LHLNIFQQPPKLGFSDRLLEREKLKAETAQSSRLKAQRGELKGVFIGERRIGPKDAIYGWTLQA